MNTKIIDVFNVVEEWDNYLPFFMNYIQEKKCCIYENKARNSNYKNVLNDIKNKIEMDILCTTEEWRLLVLLKIEDSENDSLFGRASEQIQLINSVLINQLNSRTEPSSVFYVTINNTRKDSIGVPTKSMSFINWHMDNYGFVKTEKYVQQFFGNNLINDYDGKPAYEKKEYLLKEEPNLNSAYLDLDFEELFDIWKSNLPSQDANDKELLSGLRSAIDKVQDYVKGLTERAGRNSRTEEIEYNFISQTELAYSGLEGESENPNDFIDGPRTFDNTLKSLVSNIIGTKYLPRNSALLYMQKGLVMDDLLKVMLSAVIGMFEEKKLYGKYIISVDDNTPSYGDIFSAYLKVLNDEVEPYLDVKYNEAIKSDISISYIDTNESAPIKTLKMNWEEYNKVGLKLFRSGVSQEIKNTRDIIETIIEITENNNENFSYNINKMNISFLNNIRKLRDEKKRISRNKKKTDDLDIIETKKENSETKSKLLKGNFKVTLDVKDTIKKMKDSEEDLADAATRRNHRKDTIILVFVLTLFVIIPQIIFKGGSFFSIAIAGSVLPIVVVLGILILGVVVYTMASFFRYKRTYRKIVNFADKYKEEIKTIYNNYHYNLDDISKYYINLMNIQEFNAASNRKIESMQKIEYHKKQVSLYKDSIDVLLKNGKHIKQSDYRGEFVNVGDSINTNKSIYDKDNIVYSMFETFINDKGKMEIKDAHNSLITSKELTHLHPKNTTISTEQIVKENR